MRWILLNQVDFPRSQGTIQTVVENVCSAPILLQLLPHKTSENHRFGPEQVIFILQFPTWDFMYRS